MKIRDRIRELRRVKASELRPNPKNWRTHPKRQRDALCGVLAEIGYADALLARALPDGSLELLDGHLRAETTPDMEVPVLIVDLDDAEAAKLLAVLDPLAAMAEADESILADLLQEVETESDALQDLLDSLVGGDEAATEAAEDQTPPEVEVPEAFQVVIDCKNETEQQTVFERMTAEGYKCKLLNL